MTSDMQDDSQMNSESTVKAQVSVDQGAPQISVLQRWTIFLLKHRKLVLMLYVLTGVLLFFLLFSQPKIGEPYLIEIFNR